ncbi:MAG: porin [Proteobacteria bacterium]|nr:porin [Pseudomonadota bacterium]
MASAPAFAAEMDNLKQQLRDLQNRLDQIESQQAAPPVVPAKMLRSGKKQVTLSLSGQVNRVSFIADDGELNSFFHSDNENSSTRWRLVGKAKIDSQWSAGLKIEQDIGQSNNSSGTSITLNDCKSGVTSGCEDNTTGTTFDNRQMNVWIKSKSAGKLTLGKTDTASNNIVQIDLSGTGVVQYSGANDLGGGFKFRVAGTSGAATGPKTSAVYNQLDGLSRKDQIRYDTPKFAGFSVAVAHGQGDIWDIAGRYSANYKDAGLKISAGIAYWEFGKQAGFDSGIGGSVSVLHSSGFNLTIAAATQDRSGSSIDDPTNFYIKPGFQFKATSLGKTAISAHYASATCRYVRGMSPIGEGRPYVLVQGREHEGCI